MPIRPTGARLLRRKPIVFLSDFCDLQKAFIVSPRAPLSNHEDKRHFTFDEICNTLKAKNDFTVRKRKVSTSEYEECTLQEKYIRSDDMENKLQNSPLFHKQRSPPVPPLIQAQHHVGHTCSVSIYDAPSPPIPASFRLQPRTRRRTENKKCRKVYGIENRDIWCTQCKWKKACTRFGNSDKSDKPGLMYIGDYEGLHYPM